MRVFLERRIDPTHWQGPGWGPGQFLQPSDINGDLENHCRQRKEHWVLSPHEQWLFLSSSAYHLFSEMFVSVLMISKISSSFAFLLLPSQIIWTDKQGLLLQHYHFFLQRVFWLLICILSMCASSFHNMKKGKHSQTRLFLDMETKFYCSLLEPFDFPHRDDLNTLWDYCPCGIEGVVQASAGDKNSIAHSQGAYKKVTSIVGLLTLKNHKIMAF